MISGYALKLTEEALNIRRKCGWNDYYTGLTLRQKAEIFLVQYVYLTCSLKKKEETKYQRWTLPHLHAKFYLECNTIITKKNPNLSINRYCYELWATSTFKESIH